MIQKLIHADIKSPSGFNDWPTNDAVLLKTNELHRAFDTFEFVDFKQIPHPKTGIFCSAYVFYMDKDLNWGTIVLDVYPKGKEFYLFGMESWKRLNAARCAMFAGDNS